MCVTSSQFHLQDPSYFVKAHQKAGQSGNFTIGRVLYYPPLPPTLAIEPGQLRIGEHVDNGSITLLFQDPSGGLQVCALDVHGRSNSITIAIK